MQILVALRLRQPNSPQSPKFLRCTAPLIFLKKKVNWPLQYHP